MNKPLSKCILWIFSVTLVLGCSQTTSITQQEISDNMQNNSTDESQNMVNLDPKWLDYADPKADANLAIQNNQLQLLIFSGRGTSFPGLENQQTETLKQTCGQQFLPGSSDVVTSENELDHRKKLYKYAATYNLIVAKACKKVSE